MKLFFSTCTSALLSACLAVPAVSQDTTGEASVTSDIVELVEAAGTPPEGTIVMQDKDSLLAADMIGARVFNADAQTIGKISDIIIGMDGMVEGVVIGVGGFLGMGEKPVAIQMDKISVGQTETGEPQLILAATRADLEASDPFITAAEQRAAARADELQAETQAADVTQTQ